MLRPQTIVVSDAHVMGYDGYAIPTRMYRVGASATAKRVLYCHGGGFVVGGLDSHDDVCAEIAERCQVDVLSVDYRLAPEHQYPADVNDVLAVFDDIITQGHQIVLAGDSAGGTLCASVANLRMNHVQQALLGQVLIYPALAKDFTTQSMQTHAYAPMLTKADVEYYLPMRVAGGQPPLNDPGFLPMACADFAGLPTTHLFPAEIDPLCDDCAIYAEALFAANVGVTNHTKIGEGLVHGHLRARTTSDKAAACFSEICLAIGLLLK